VASPGATRNTLKDTGDEAQLAPTAREQTRHVIARHVLHHLPTKGEVLAFAIDHACAQHKVAHSAHAGACWATQARRHHAANRRTGTKVRWLEGKALTLVGQRCLDLGQGRATPSGYDQLAGLVAQDAAVGGGVQHLTLQGLAQKVFGAATAQTQRLTALGGLKDAVREMLEGWLQSVLHGQHGSRWAWRTF